MDEHWVCGACGCEYAAAAPCCPECRANQPEEENGVPKITTAGISYEPGHEPEGYEPPDPTPGPVPDSTPEPSSPGSSAPADPEPAPAKAAPKPAPKSSG